MTSLGCPQLLDDDFATLPSQSLGGSAGASGNGAGGAEPGAGGSLNGSGNASGSGGDAGSGAAGSASGGSSGQELDASTNGGASGGDGGLAPEAGIPDPETPLGLVIRHRYSFDGSGTAIADSVGSAPGTALGGAQLAAGKITLSGSGQYVNLPNGIISALDSATLEAWINWTGDPDPLVTSSIWQTLFSFGNNSAGEDAQSDEATTYVFLTPKANESFDVRGAYTISGFGGELRADGPDDALPPSSDPVIGSHVALVLDSAAGRVRLYIEGALVETSAAGSIDLSAIDDVNNWIGRSQFAIDPDFQGDVLEFRIYGAALSASELSLSFSLGPNAEL